jgi:hypothetical protein
MGNIGPLLSLPAELRIQILSYVFVQQPDAGFIRSEKSSTLDYHGLVIDNHYSPAFQLNILSTCRQFRRDFTTIAFRNTTFLVRDNCVSLHTLLRRLQSHQLASLRRVAFVTSPKRIRELVEWTRYPFDMENVHLEELTVVLYRSEHWHYPSHYTRDLVALLRRLEHVKALKFVRNSAPVSGSFRTWYNRLIGLLLKEDHYQRYDAPDAPNVEATWWEWRYDYADNTFELIAQSPKPVLPEAEYIGYVAPLVRRLMSDMEDDAQ